MRYPCLMALFYTHTNEYSTIKNEYCPSNLSEREIFMLAHRLTQLKEKSGLTNQQIADKSGVPLSTVTRIFNGQTDNPTYRNVADIVSALGGSLDAMEGIEHPHEKTPEKVLELYERMVERQRRYIKFLFFTLLALVGVIIILSIVDLTHSNIGYLRY